MTSATAGRLGATASIAAGAAFAAAPSFSGLALLTVLVTGGAVAALLFVAPYPSPTTERPGGRSLARWLGWATLLVVFEGLLLLANDDLRWPTLSALQDPVTSQRPVGRFVAGALWAAAGFGLVALTRRYRAETSRRSPLGPVTAVAVCLALGLLGLLAAGGGAFLEPRNGTADTGPAVGDVGTTPPGDWAASTWLAVAALAIFAAAAVLIHRLGRRDAPPGGIDDLLAWLMAPWIGRTVTFAAWLWCGWHFLAR